MKFESLIKKKRYINIFSNKYNINYYFKYYNRYDGYFVFLYYKALAGWHIGKTQESKDLFLELINNPNNDLDERYKILISETVENLGLSHLVKNFDRDGVKNT